MNSLTFISVSHKKNYKTYSFYKCVCGAIKLIREDHVKSNKIKSCGCLLKTNPPAKTHGMTQSKEFTIWCDMKKRCYNENADNYKYYGGKGINVCERWKHSFENFLEDMGLMPTNTSSIERIDTERDYEPNNCEWIELKDQAKNRSNTIYVEYNGDKMTLVDVCKLLKITYKTGYRLYKQNTLQDKLKTLQ